MNNKYFIYNNRLLSCLSLIDKYGNSIFQEGTYDEMLSVLNNRPDKADLEVISEMEFKKRQERLMTNKAFMEASNRLSNKIYEELHAALEGTDIGESMKYETAIRNRNINGFPSTTTFDSDKMVGKLCDKMDAFQESIVNNLAFNYDASLLNDVNENIQLIKRAWSDYNNGNQEKATQEIRKILDKYVNDPFIVSTLDESYASRQMACFDSLNYNSLDAGIIGRMAENSYDLMKNHPLTFYRGRKSTEVLATRKELLHRPYVRNEKIERQRFTCSGIPALYLSSTSYGCWLECGRPEKNFYVSCFVPNEKGLKLKVLNLLDNQYLIDGFGTHAHENCVHSEAQKKLISLFPLTLATSFKYTGDKNEEQYIIPELVMRALENIDIDGIAYTSKYLKSDQQFQIGINIAFPVYKEHLIEGYGKICRCFDMTEPVLLDENREYTEEESGSFIYDVYYKNSEEIKWKPPVNPEDGNEEYGKTKFAKFDNHLANQRMGSTL